jgi:transposase
VITLEDWALIRRLAAEGVPKARIARRLGISRTTVIKAVNSESPPRYERSPGPTSFTVFESRVRALLEATPDMPATVLAERVGWTGSIRWFSDNVRRLRPEHRPIDPADRLTWAPGDAAQCDLWFPPRRIPLEDRSTRLLPVLVITAAHSRFMTARMIPTRTTEDLLLGSWELIGQLGRVPRRLIWDNEPGIGRGQRRAEGVTAFMGTLATKLVLLPPRDPESKGLLERRNGWFETSFMPGRSFSSPADFNTQFTEWLTRANRRVVRTIKAAPVDLIDADRAAMLPLPPAPLQLGWRNTIRLGRDYYVRLDTNDYSVDPTVIGRMVEVAGDLDRVRVRAGGRLVAEHPRVWARGTTITDPDHVETAARLRKQFQHPGTDPAASDDLVRDLSDYDRAFGLNDVNGDQARGEKGMN